QSVGAVAFWFIIAIGVLQGLAALEMSSLVEPLQGALDEIGAHLPNLFGAMLLLIPGIILARIAGRVVSAVLTELGFDRFVFGTLPRSFDPTPKEGDPDLPIPDEAIAAAQANGNDVGEVSSKLSKKDVAPSRFTGHVVTILIGMLVSLEALSILGLDRLATILQGFIEHFLPNAVISAVIILAGLWVGNWTKDLIDRAALDRNEPFWRYLGSLSRIGIFVFVLAIALHQVGVSPELIRIAFAVLFGAVGVAFALAFGLGGREVASEIVRAEYHRNSKVVETTGNEDLE
ncbi:MAG: hypothetical protein KC561_20120, partial [Myxococcales bacterium]|nr:hypothetical protein [Myxococcales bacterium]